MSHGGDAEPAGLTTPRPAGRSLRFRADIQGLRAYAVALVVADHLLGWPGGGFIGVDVFFVISGFLITSLLLREFEATGTISFRDFYVRRVKRILPAALVVLAVTVALGYLVWFLPRANQTALDALSAALFVENWHLVVTGADYLQADGPVSPVQHYWSLSIEEQFYALWPLALVLGFRFLGLGHRPGRLAVLIGAGVLVSASWAAYRTGSDPAAAYFDTVARTGELLVGALAAVSAGRLRIGARARGLLSLGGLALVVGAAVVVTPSSPFPFPWVALPVLGAVLIIAADPSAAARTARLLTNPVAQYVGRISYSIYLWHFPVIVFGIALFGSSATVRVAALAITLVVSAASYRWVEQAVLRRKSPPQAADGAARTRAPGMLLPVGVAVVLVLVTGLQFRGPDWLRNADALAVEAPASTIAEAPSVAQLEGLVADAARATAWPVNLSPTLDDLGAGQQAEAMKTSAPGCRNDVAAAGAPLICRYGDGGGASAFLVGDSVAMSWMPTVRQLYGAGRVQGVGFGDCPLVDVAASPGAVGSAFVADCQRSRQAMQSLVERERPDVLVLSAAQGYFGQFVSGATGEAATREWQRGLESVLRRVQPFVGETVVMGNPPLGEDVRACATRFSSPTRCATSPGSVFEAKVAAEQAAVAGAVARGQQVRYVATEPLFCMEDVCPPFIGRTLLRTDTTHLTAAAAELVAAAVRGQIS